MNELMLVARAAEIEQSLMESGGELTPELEAELKQVAENVDAVSTVLARSDHAIEYWKAQSAKSAAIARGLAASQIRLRDLLRLQMASRDLNELRGSQACFKLVPCAKRLVIDEKQLDPAYQMQVMSVIPDKSRIKESLEAGLTISGASLEGGTALREYVNRKAVV